MEKFFHPHTSQWHEICARPVNDSANFASAIRDTFSAIEKEGDAAVRKFTKEHDSVDLQDLVVTHEQLDAWAGEIDEELQTAIDTAYDNIRTFHEPQRQKSDAKITTSEGVVCWRETRPIERIGLYVPGGSAPLFSTLLMLGIPAQLAGCEHVTLCTPPQRDGSVHPAICYAAKKVGIDKVIRVGGAQAIAAMSLGTDSIPKVDKIFGPGNQYVTEAKMQAQKYGVAIDMPAGPSEVMVVADHTANPTFAAADLLSQAEHGEDSQVILVTNDQDIADTIETEVEKQLKTLPRKDTAAKALEQSSIVVLKNTQEIVEFINLYAPEHLILSIEKPEATTPHINNAGSVFLGNFTPESAGDYASGTNHTLPTNGWARSYSGLSVESFMKYITFQSITEAGAKKLAPTVISMAQAEGLDAHKNAMEVRT